MSVLTLVVTGGFTVLALVIPCFAAYKIKAKRFEFSAAIWKLASFKITIMLDEDVKPASRKRRNRLRGDSARKVVGGSRGWDSYV